MPKHIEAGIDPFTMKKQEKKLVLEKEKLRKLKNDLHAVKTQFGAKSLKSATEILESKNGNKSTAASDDQIKKQ